MNAFPLINNTEAYLLCCVSATKADEILELKPGYFGLLKEWRNKGIGPKHYLKKNGRAVYPIDELFEFKNDVRRSPTLFAQHFIPQDQPVAKILGYKQNKYPVIASIRKRIPAPSFCPYHITFICPFCGEQHQHGHNGGQKGGNGYRVAHCGWSSKTYMNTRYSLTYYLLEVTDPELAGFPNSKTR